MEKQKLKGMLGILLIITGILTYTGVINIALATVYLDGTPPVCSNYYPAGTETEPSTVALMTGSITLQVTAQDPETGIKSVQCKVTVGTQTPVTVSLVDNYGNGNYEKAISISASENTVIKCEWTITNNANMVTKKTTYAVYGAKPTGTFYINDQPATATSTHYISMSGSTATINLKFVASQYGHLIPDSQGVWVVVKNSAGSTVNTIYLTETTTNQVWTGSVSLAAGKWTLDGYIKDSVGANYKLMSFDLPIGNPSNISMNQVLGILMAAIGFFLVWRSYA